MCKKNTNASATLFGWDFQINAAIVLLLENIAVAKQVRVEGKTEDIEITLSDGSCIYSQAKSVVKSSSDYTHVKRNLEKGLSTLAIASESKNCGQLIYITNSNNPLKDQKGMSIFYGHSRRDYNSLPPSSKKAIDDVLMKKDIKTLDTSKLTIHVLPFETDDLDERYKVVVEVVRDLMGSIKPELSAVSKEALDIWQKQLFENATLQNTDKVITKEAIMWPLIVITADQQRYENPFRDSMDDTEYAEISSKFKSFINSRCERFEFATRIVSAFQSFDVPGVNRNSKVLEFIESRWRDYIPDFYIEADQDDLQEKLIKIVLLTIIHQRFLVNDVRKRVNL